MCQCTDPNVESVRGRLLVRAETGLTKYGTDTTRTDLSRADWLRHAQEEALDLAVYLERLIRDEGNPVAQPTGRSDPDDDSDDWEAAGDLVRHNTRFEPDTPDWERAQTAVLAGIMHGREQAAQDWQSECARHRDALTRLRAENDRLRAALAAIEAGLVVRGVGAWYAGRVEHQCRHPTLAAALAVIGLGTGEGEGR